MGSQISREKSRESNPTIFGLITARGGSKGILRKNISPVAGKPLIAWTIEAAQNSKVLSRLIVSTDDEDIAAVAEDFNAEVPFRRPAELAQDNSPHTDVIVHAVKWLQAEQGNLPDYVMLLQPTSPCRTAKDIDRAGRLAIERRAEAVFSVYPTSAHPYLCKRIATDGTLTDFVNKPAGYLSRQNLPPAYALNGAIFLIRCELVFREAFWENLTVLPYIMPEERSLDIDTEWDLYLADTILRKPLLQGG